jgi:hypothetical protein
VLVAVGAELWTFADPDGTRVAVDDLEARLGLTAIEELELLADGGLALYGAKQLVVLAADGTLRWRTDLGESNLGRERLFVAPDGGVYAIDTRPRGTEVLSAPPTLRRFAADGTPRFALELEADVTAAFTDGDDVITVEIRQLSDRRDEEGRPDDFGFYLLRRSGVDGVELARLFLGSTDDLGVSDVARMVDGRVALVGWADDHDLPVLRFYRLP